MSENKKKKNKPRRELSIAVLIGVAFGLAIASIAVSAMTSGGLLCGDLVENGVMIRQHSDGAKSRSQWRMERAHGTPDK